MTVTVSSGVTSSGLTVSSGDPLVVLSGGTVLSSTILSGGSATLSTGATGSNLTVAAGGLLAGVVGSRTAYLEGDTTVAGSISDLTIDQSASLEISSGGVAMGVTAWGYVTVSAGATLDSSTTVFGQVDIFGSASGFSNDYGYEYIESGGVTFGDMVVGSPDIFGDDPDVASQTILSGGVASQTTLLTEGYQFISSGGIAVSTTLSGSLVASGAAGPRYDGGYQIISSGGAASSTTVLNGARAFVSAGGKTFGDVIQAGGTLTLSSGAIASGVQNAGLLDLNSGAVAGGVQNNGIMEFDDVTLGSSGALQALIAGVTGSGVFELTDVTIEAGITISTAANVILSGLVVSSGSELLGSAVIEGEGYVAGSVDGLTVSAFYWGNKPGQYIDGGLVISSGGTASDVTLDRSGIYAEKGATASGTIVGFDAYVSVEGLAIDTLVRSGGAMDLYSGGRASGGQVSSDGTVSALLGGATAGLTVYGGGSDDVLVSGTTTGTVLRSGGHELVWSGGVASGARVLSGSIEYVLSGGIDRGAIVSSGGRELISSGGTASGLSVLAGGAVVDNGAMRFVSAGSLDGVLSGSGQLIKTGSGDLVLSGTGAKFSGETVIGGGTIELAGAAALGTSEVVFVKPSTGSAVLQVDAADLPKAGATFANTLSSFDGAGESLDLRGLAYASGASATVSGSTLTLSDGGKTYLFKLAGGEAAGGYTVASDGHGGTTIDPKVAAMVQAAATLQATSGGLSPVSSATVSGAAAMLAAGATASAAGLHG